MAVIRVNKTKDYTVMSNIFLKEKEMSLKAKGLLALMFSLPDDWDYSISGLTTLVKDGKYSVMNALKELEKLGYLKRTRTTDERGRFTGYDYDIFESPYSGKSTTDKSLEQNSDLKLNVHSLRKMFAENFIRTGVKLHRQGLLQVDFEVFDLLQKKMMHTNFDSTLRYTEFAEEDWETISLNMNIGLEILNQYC